MRNIKTNLIFMIKVFLVVILVFSSLGLQTVYITNAAEKNYYFREKILLPEGLMIVNESFGNPNSMYVTMLDSKTLALKWQQSFYIHTGGGCGTRYLNRYCLKDNMLFGFDTTDYFVKCIDVSTGKIIWRTGYKGKEKTNFASRNGIGISKRGLFFYASTDDVLMVFDKNTGKLVNKFEYHSYGENNNTIEIIEGFVYSDNEKGYSVINALTGKTLYTFPKPKNTTYENLGAFHETEFFVDKEGYGYIRNAKDMPCKFDVKTGKIIWTGKKAIVANFAYEDKDNLYLYATSHDYKKPGAKIASIRKSDGKTNWEINTSFVLKDVQASMASFGSGSGRPAEDPMPMCPGTSFQVNFLGDKVIVGLGTENLGRKSNIGFQMFRLSDGKELVRKSFNVNVASAILLPDRRNLFAENGDYYTIIDSWTGKDKTVTPKFSNTTLQRGFNLHNNLLSLTTGNEKESMFTVFDISSGRTVWTLPDKDNDQDYIFTINGKIIITGSGVIDIFDLKTGKLKTGYSCID